MIRILVFLLLVSICAEAKAQTKTTKETKVVVIVSNNTIDAIEHFETYRNNQEALIKKYPKSKFFIGLLKGKYTTENDEIIPQSEATITIYTEKQIFHKTGLFTNNKPEPGDLLVVGKTKAKVIVSKKGEMVIKTNK